MPLLATSGILRGFLGFVKWGVGGVRLLVALDFYRYPDLSAAEAALLPTPCRRPACHGMMRYGMIDRDFITHNGGRVFYDIA
jgi:hypothetical protein